jgi:hypothetical protein
VQSLALGALANSSGPTLTRLPAATSVMQGAAQTGSCESTNQRGFVPSNLAQCDAGAAQTHAVDGRIVCRGLEAE